MKRGSHHQPYTKWPSRPFKILYYYRAESNGEFVRTGIVVSCSSPEAVVRSTALRLVSDRADEAWVWLDDTMFAVMSRQSDNALRFTVF